MLEGFNVLEYFTVALIKSFCGRVECLEIFRVSREAGFRLWGRVGFPIRLIPVSGSMRCGMVHLLGRLSLGSHLFLRHLLFLLTGGLLRRRRVNCRRIVEGGRRGCNSPPDGSHGG